MPDRSTTRKSPVVPLVVAAVALLAVVLTFVASRGDDGGAATSPTSAEAGSRSGDRAPEETWQQLVRREEGDPMAIGETDAPVVMVAYSEFQCPFCGKYARDTEPTLIDQYVDSGVLRIEWRDFPYLGSESMTAARGGRAAAAQDRFWEFSSAMYADQLPPNSGRLTEDYLAAVAEDLGLDVARFREDMAAAGTKQAIEQDFVEGQAIGVTGTPAFIINGVPVIGAQPTEVFEQAIEQAAAEADADAS